MTPPQPPLPPMSRHRRPSAHSIARLETVVEAVEEQQSGRVPRVEDGTTGRTVTSESATSSPTASRRPRRIVVSWGSGSASAAGAAGASTAGASTAGASTTAASATGANSTTRPRTTSSTSSMRSSSHRLPILRQQRALSTASMHNPPVAVPTSPVVGSITSITSPLLPATPAASPVAQQQQHLTPHTKRLGDQLLLMEFELLDALERNGVKGKEEGTMMTTTANAGSSSRYGMSSSPIPIHGRSSMSTELARRESIGSATAHASRTTTAHTMSPPATPPPGSAGNKFLSSADPAKIAALRAFHRKHRRAFLWACGTGLLLLLVTIITLALVLPTCSLLGCHVPTLYEELMGIVMRQNGTMALFKAGELEAYPRLKELAVFLGSTTTKSFGSQGVTTKDYFRLRSVFQPNSTPSLDAFAGFHFHRPSTKHALLLGKPICGRVDPDTPILGLTPTSAQQNFVRLPYFQNYKTDELTVSNWTDTSMHRNHTGNGGALTDVTEESAANARVPDSTLALCCIDFFMAEPGTGPDQLFVEDLSDPALQSRPAERKRIPKERVDARLLCQTTRSIGGAWTGMSAIAPWTLASDGSIRPTIDQTNYTWPRALGTGLNRAPIGWMNETDVAFLVTSEEAHQAGRGVMVHATASIAVDALAPLKSLVRDADVQLVNTTMRAFLPFQDWTSAALDYTQAEFEFTVDNHQLTHARIQPSPWLDPATTAPVTILRVAGTTLAAPPVDAQVGVESVRFETACPRAYRATMGDYCVLGDTSAELVVASERIVDAFVGDDHIPAPLFTLRLAAILNYPRLASTSSSDSMGVSTSFPLGNVPLVVALPKGVEKAQVYVVATVVRAAGNGWLRVADLLSTTNETVALHREQVTLLPNELLVWTSPRGGLLEFAFHMKDEKLWANRTLTIRPALSANHLFPPTAVKLSGANLPEIIRASGFGDIFKSIGRADPAVQLSVFSTMYWTNLARSRSLSEVSVGRALEALAVVNRTWNEDVPAQVQQGGSPGPYLTTMAQWTQHVAVPSAAVQWLTSSNSSFSPAVLTSPSALAPLANGLSASASKKLSTSSTNLALNLFTLPPTDVDGDLPKTRRGWLGFRAEVKRVDVPHYADFMLKAQPLRSTVHRYFTSQDVTRRVLIAEERLELLVAQSSANRNIGDVAVRAVLPVLDELVPMAQELFAATRQQFEGAVLAFMPFIQAYVRDAKFVQSANLKVLSENFHYLKDFTARQEIYQESRGSKNLRPIDVATLIGGDALTPLIESLSLRDTNGTQVNSVTATSNTILSNTFLEWFAGLDDAAAASMGTSKDGDTDEAMSVCRVDSSLCADMPAVRQDLVTLNRILLERELSAITALSATPRHFPFEVDTTSRYRTGMYARPSNFTIAVERMAAKQVNRDNWMTLVCLDFLRLSTAEQLREDGGEIKTSLLSEYAGMVVPSSSSTSFDNAATTNDWTLLMLRASNLGYFLNQRSTNDTYLSARTMRILRLFSTLLRADPTTGRPLYVTDPHWLAEAVAQLLAVN